MIDSYILTGARSTFGAHLEHRFSFSFLQKKSNLHIAKPFCSNWGHCLQVCYATALNQSTNGDVDSYLLLPSFSKPFIWPINFLLRPLF